MKPFYFLINKVLFFFIFQLLNTFSFGQTTNDYRSAATGNWNALATWERYNGTTWATPTAGEGSPTNGVGVITVRNNHVVSVTANVTIDQSTIDAGGQISVNSGITLTIANGTGTDLVVNGTLQNNNTVTTTGTLSFGANSTYTHSRNGGTIPTAAWDVTSTCNVTGVTGTVPGGLSQTFGNFTWNCTGQSSNRNLNGNLTTVDGNFTVASTGTGGDVLRLTNGTDLTLDIGSDFILSGGDLLFTNNNSNVTVNVAKNFSQSGGSLDFSDDNQIGVLILNVTTDFSQSGGFFDFASGNANTTRTPALNLSGNFSQSGSATMITSTGDADIVNGTITFNKNGTQQYTVSTPANITYTNFKIANNSLLQLNSNISLISSSTVVWGGTFTVNSGGTLDAGTNQVISSTGASAGSNNIFTLSSGGSVKTSNTNGLQSGTSGTISTSLATRTFSSGANYVFKSSVTGTFTTTPTAATVNNFIVDRSGGVSMSQPIAVNGAFTLTSGVLTTTLTNILTINDNATSTTGSTTTHVSGPMLKIGNDVFTFPVGKSGVYGPIGISAPGAATDAFRAEYIRASSSALGSITASGLKRVSNCEYWNLDNTAGTATVNVALSWSGQSPCNAAAYVDDLATITISQFNGTNWNSHGNNGGTTGNASAGTVTWNSVSAFGPFTLGSTSDTKNPLPVKFGNINGFIKGAGVQIEWKIFSEENVSHYEIERSANGGNFYSIGSTNALNLYTETKYLFFDATPLPGVSFYRIRSIDYDARFIFSTIIKINSDKNGGNEITIYPNPLKGEYLSFQSDNLQRGNYSFIITGINGQQIYTQPFSHTGGTITQVIKLPSSIKPGMYALCLESNGHKVSSKSFILQ